MADPRRGHHIGHTQPVWPRCKIISFPPEYHDLAEFFRKLKTKLCLLKGLLTAPLTCSLAPPTHPLIDPAYRPLNQATVCSKLDLRNAYYLILIHKGDEWKTTFKDPLSHFEYQVMPYKKHLNGCHICVSSVTLYNELLHTVGKCKCIVLSCLSHEMFSNN